MRLMPYVLINVKIIIAQMSAIEAHVDKIMLLFRCFTHIMSRQILIKTNSKNIGIEMPVAT